MLLIFLFFSTIAKAQFIPTSEPLQGVWAGESTWGDLDNDGDLDLIVSGSVSFLDISSTVYQNDGGHLVQMAIIAGIDGGAIDLGDFNQDGLIDILMVGSVENRTSVGTLLFQNRGNFQFEKATHNLPGLIRGDAKFGDFDNDGDEDVLLVGSGFTYSYHDIFVNNGGSFSPLGLSMPKYGDPSISIGDYDLDSDLDYVVVGSDMTSVPSLFKNQGSNKFIPVSIYPNSIYDGDVAFGDFNNDRYLDILIMGYDEALDTDLLILFENTGGEGFTKTTSNMDGLSEGNVTWGDMDNDGDLDIVITGKITKSPYTPSTAVYLNNNGSFTKNTSGLLMLDFSNVAIGDVDNDLDLDLVVSGTADINLMTGTTQLYLNASASPNTRPSPPVSLAATLDGQQATLSWGKSADAETAQAGLTYAFYINRLPGQNHLGQTLSTSDGFRKVVKMGNAQHNTTWVVDNLEPGIYYWGVQCIDASFTGSMFSSEENFTIDSHPPLLISMSSLSEEAGNVIELKGKNFIGTTSVKLNGNESSFQIINSTTLKVIVPNITGAGYFEVTSAGGTATSTQSFCVIPSKPILTGNTTVCPGVASYSVSSIEGITYNWSVDTGGEIIENNSQEIKIHWKSRGTYVVHVTPQTCALGSERTLTVTVTGPEWKQILGNLSPTTESIEQYYTSYVFGENHQWTMSRDGQTIGSSSEATYTIKWNQPGVYSLKLSTTNGECPVSPVENAIEFSVTKSAFSYNAQIPFNSSKISLADLDNDGDQDMIVDGYKIFENIMPSGFQQKTSSLPTNTSSVRYADVDGDYDLDLLLVYKVNSLYTLVEVLNLGAFTFGTPRKIAEKLSTPAIDLMDFDNDGDLDIVSMEINSIVVYERLASNEYQRIEAYTNVENGNLKGTFKTLDFDSDGRMDIVTSSSGVFLNTGTKSFIPQIINFPISFTGEAMWEDLDQDGDFDLAEMGSGKIQIYNNDANIFSKIYSIDSSSPVHFVDMNADGWKDMVVEAGPTQLCLYDPNIQSFTSPVQRFDALGSTKNNSTTLAGISDLNRDGKNDFLIYGNVLGTPALFFFTNNSENVFLPITIHEQESFISGNQVRLSWQGDASHSFEVIVGTSPGAIDKVNTTSDINSGYRKISAAGNANHRNFFTLDNLTPGTYYWSVQVVDNGLMGSPFSQSSSFVVKAPTLNAPNFLRTYSTATGIRLTWNDNSDNESGFIIERSDNHKGSFVPVDTVLMDLTNFNDNVELTYPHYYRIKAFNNDGESYYSEVVSTQHVIISMFPYYESFEKTTNQWHQLDYSEESVIYSLYNSADWTRYKNPFGSIDGDFALQLQNGYTGSKIAAVESPYFDLSSMTNPCLVFYVAGPQKNLVSSIGGIRVYGTIDNELTWKYVTGVGTEQSYWSRAQALLNNYKSSISKFRIAGLLSSTSGQILSVDNIRIVECPTNPGNPLVTQSGSNGLMIRWNESVNADQYILERLEDSGSYVRIDTLDAPINSYLDKNLVVGKVYKYRIQAVNYDGPAYSEFGVSAKISLVPNKAPVIELIAAQEMKAMTWLFVEANLVDETPISDLSISVESSDPLLLPIENITIEKKIGMVTIIIVSNTENMGLVRLTLKVNDGDLTSESAFDLTITEKNITPVIISQKLIYSIDEDNPFELSLDQLIVEDIDGDVSKLTLEVLPGQDYVLSGNNLQPALNFNGQLLISIKINDGFASSDVFQFTLNVVAVNDAPIVKSAVLAELYEDHLVPFSLDLLIVDDPDDNFPVDFSMTVGEGQNYTFQDYTIIPAPDFYGTLNIPIQVSDGTAWSEIYELKLQVLTVNDPPVLTGIISSYTFNEDEVFFIPIESLAIEDKDSQLDDMTVIIIDGENYSVTGGQVVPDYNFNGILTISLKVFDGVDYSETIEAEVIVTPVNDVPVILQAYPLPPVYEDEEFAVSIDILDVYDVDNSASDLSLEILPGINYEIENEIIRPLKDFEGLLKLYCRVFDGEGYSETIELPVSVIPLNDAPIIRGVQPLIAYEDLAFSIPIESLEIYDPDNSFPQDFSLIINEGTNFIIKDGQIIPFDNFHETLEIHLKLSDGIDVSDVYKIFVEVLSVNDPPIINGTNRSFIIKEADQIFLELNDFVITDVDNGASDHSLIILEGENYITSGNSVQPIDGYFGVLNVEVQISDGINVSGIYIIHITVDQILGIGESNLNDVEMYPNPNRGKFSITLPIVAGTTLIRVIDLAGHELFNRSVSDVNKLELDIRIPPGTYFLEVIVKDKKVVKKFIVN